MPDESARRLLPPTALLLAVALSLLFLSSCASVRPGTGDIAFRLRWEGEADLDLHVEDPEGEHIHFVIRRSTTGGELDVDCNASPEQICGAPIENVFWPVGGAPEGTYTYWVELFQAQNTPGPVPFTVQVLLGETPAETRTGVARAEVPKAGPFEYTFRRARPKAGRVAQAARAF